MKNLLLSGFLLLFSLAIMAQTPAMFNYQAVVRDANSDILINTEINLMVEILKSDIDGSVVFNEQHVTSTNAYGVVNVKIGSVNSLEGIDWSDDSYFVRISVDGAVLGTSQLISVPYALHAKTAENVFSGNYDDLTNVPDMSAYLTDISTRNLGELADVDITGLTDNQILKYNAGLGKWISIDVAAASESDPVYSASPAFAITNAGSGMIITSAERIKLNGIESGAQVNVNPDWNAVAGDAQILNKPSFSAVAISGDYSDLINIPGLFDGTWTSLTGKPAFSTVAISGNYNDLTNLPGFTSVATTGDYNDLTNKPILFNGTWSSLTGKPAFSTVATSGNYSDLINLPTLSTVAGTGNYNDLTNKPVTISTAQANAIDANTLKRSYPLADETKLAGIQVGAEVNVNADWNALNGDAQILNKPVLSTVAISGNYNELSNKPALFDGTWTSLSGKPSFATVATSGNFNDLTNKPTTIAGYGITNAMTTSHAANGITSTNISNWSTAYSWGNHAGLYRASTWVPTWTDISGKPSFSTVATSGNYNDLLNKPAFSAVANTGNYTDLLNAPVLATIATSGNYSDLTGTPDLSSYATKNMNNANITNLANPVNNQDAATKSYADLKFQMLLNYMVESGADVQGLLDAGVTVEELVEAEASIADLIAGGATVSDLFTMGVCVGTLRKAGALEADLIAAGLVGTLTDYEGNIYGWVKIGNQIWMDENLKSTKYSNGDNMTEYYSYNYDNLNIPVYGLLYNLETALQWHASSDNVPSGVQGACPTGWHIPSKSEWRIMENFLLYDAYGIDTTNIGKSLASTTLWAASPTTGNVGNDQSSNNDSGFDALPAGNRNSAMGWFTELGQAASFYSSTWDQSYDKFDSLKKLFYDQSGFPDAYLRYCGYPIRCLKD